MGNADAADVVIPAEGASLAEGEPSLPDVPGVRHHFVDAGGLRLHVAEAEPAGTASRRADPVLCLHSFPQHWYAWRRVIGLLAPEYRMICPDLAGFGWSEAPARGYDSAAGVRDVLALMDALGVERAALIGHHWGGILGFRACLAAPERFSSLLAVNCTHPWALRRRLVVHAWRNWYTVPLEYPGIGRRVLAHWPAYTRFLLRRGVVDSTVWDDGEIEEYAAALRIPAQARAGEQIHWQFVRHEIPALVTGRYRRARLVVPTLLLGGADDPVTPPGLLAGGLRHADHLDVEVVQGAGQYLPVEAPDRVAAAARRLFAAEPGNGHHRTDAGKPGN